MTSSQRFREHSRRRLFAVGATAVGLSLSMALPANATTGRGPAGFSWTSSSNAQAGVPADVALDNGNVVTAWIDYSANSAGELKVCTIVRGAGGCFPGSLHDLGVIETPQDSPQSESGNLPIILAGANGEIVILGGDDKTYAYVSHDDAATFAAPVIISSILTPGAAELADGGSQVLLAGASATGGDPYLLQFMQVPLDGSGVATPPVVEPQSGSNHWTVGYFNSQPVVAASTSTATTSVYQVTYYYSNGGNPNVATTWTGGEIANSVLPSLMTTANGLVLAAAYQTPSEGDDTYPRSYVFTGAGFKGPFTIAHSGLTTRFVAGAATGLSAAKDRYTVTYDQAGCEDKRCAYFSVTSRDGQHWTKPLTIGNIDNVFSSFAAISPDGGGLAVQVHSPGFYADRIYVGTTITTSLGKHKGDAAAKFQATIRDDLGSPVPHLLIRVYYKQGRFVKLFRSIKSDSGGRISFSYHNQRTTVLQAVFAGDTVYDPSLGTTTYVVKTP